MANPVVVDFPRNFTKALNDGQLRRNLRTAMDTLGLRRRTLFSDPVAFEQLRARGDAIRQRALRKLPELLERRRRETAIERREPAGISVQLPAEGDGRQ